MHQTAPNVEEIFLAALEIEGPEARSSYLDEVCGDTDLRRHVERLLALDARASGFLECPASPPAEAAGYHRVLEGPGTVVGPYKLMEQIGEGGMGDVYLAEQTHPVHRKVALKIIKPGMDTREVIDRFEAERQALAMMDHPNIAKVHDAGATESGRPYFVMELVGGIPITDYCDHERLSIPERLKLFVLVCRAVHHAHQKGIIHRDLKPSNILVMVIDGAAVPKVIDFGVAKATGASLTERTIYTSFQQFIGTPLYMSPEQADLSGKDVDTRSDIYSLGVMLYELLTGTTPFDQETFRQAAIDEVCRIIREREPVKPSTRLSLLGATRTSILANRKADARHLDRAVRGELDWIVMKALEKDRRRRYETVSDFAADVIRYLTDQPVAACPPSHRYRFLKFARRNRAVLTTGALVLAALFMGAIVSTWQALRATQAARESQRELLIQQILNILSTQRTYGWSDSIEDRIRRAARLGPDEDHRLQSYAAASLGGLDARLIKEIAIETDTLAFDPGGKKLFLCDIHGQVWVWDGSANPIHKIGVQGAGPFAFQPDGTAVHLHAAAKNIPAEIELWALEPPRLIRRFRSPIGSASTIESMAIGPDATLVAATIRSKDNREFAAVWNSQTAAVVRQTEIGGASALAISPDGRWLAAGTKEGDVTVLPLPQGDALPRFTTGRLAVASLAFGRHRLSHARPARPSSGWLLAVGDVAAGLTVFDFGERSVRSQCRGSNYDVRSVSFSPDGMLLASAGRREPILWDVSTGQPILRLGIFDSATSIVLSPDGRQVAVSSNTAYGSSGAVQVYALQNGRGFQTLWGLDSEIDKTAISQDGRLVAALSQDFRVGIWEPSAGRLLHVLEVPIGIFTDSAGLTFSPDGRRFVYAAGTQCKMWDVDTGKVLRSWRLPEGFQDNLAFLDADHLVSTRVETSDPKVRPYGTDSVEFPRILRIRNLNAEPPELLGEITDFNRHVFHSELSRDGRSLLIEGLSGPTKAEVRLMKAFEVAGNRALWTIQGAHPEVNASVLHFDPTGRVFMRGDQEGRIQLLEFRTRALIETYERGDARKNVSCLSPGGELFLSGHPAESPYQLGLWTIRRESPLLTVAKGAPMGMSSQFSLDGQLGVWGNHDGTVTVFELAEVQRRLARFGLGW
jgi:serine/threonine protein kinase/WD40 repeat protein